MSGGRRGCVVEEVDLDSAALAHGVGDAESVGAEELTLGALASGTVIPSSTYSPTGTTSMGSAQKRRTNPLRQRLAA